MRKGSLEVPVLVALPHLRGCAVHTRQLVRLIHARKNWVQAAKRRSTSCSCVAEVLVCTQEVHEGVLTFTQEGPAQVM